MSSAVIRPLAGPPPAPPAVPPETPARQSGAQVLPAFRFIPSASPLLGDIGVLANTYARAAAEAEAAREDARDAGAPGGPGADQPPKTDPVRLAFDLQRELTVKGDDAALAPGLQGG